jgi:hypothetical protein
VSQISVFRVNSRVVLVPCISKLKQKKVLT